MLFLPALRDFQGMEYSLLNQGSPRKTRTSWLLNCGVFINQTFPVSLPLLTFHLTSAYWCSLLWWIGAKASCKRRPSINQGLYNILIWRDSGKKAKSPFQFRSIPGPKDDWGYLTSLTHSPSLPAAVLRKGQAQPPQKWGAQDTGEVTEPQMRCRLLMSPLHPHHISGGAPGSPTLQMRKLSPRERHLSRHSSDSSRSEAEFKPKPHPPSLTPFSDPCGLPGPGRDWKCNSEHRQKCTLQVHIPLPQTQKLKNAVGWLLYFSPPKCLLSSESIKLKWRRSRLES